jgi:hypothetical protein
MAGYTRNGLKSLLLTHAAEIKFIRRTEGRLPRTRRMWCTLDPLVLNSAAGKKILNFRKPRFAPAYNAASKNLLVVWDIIMQDWRAVPVDAVYVVEGGKTIPTRFIKNLNDKEGNKRAQDEFWYYYQTAIRKMTPGEKSSFMDR